jgi:predicted dehydrogenase
MRRETVSHPDVDLVCITTPPNLHRDMALAAIEHGKHVLCEKPMAMNIAEAEEMTAAAEGKQILALIDHELRFQDGRRKAFRMLRDGAIGKVRHAKAIFRAPGRGNPDLPWNWWSDASVGGGALGAIASHVIDSLNWFLGTQVASVFCQLQTHIKQRRDRSGEIRDVTSDDESNMLLRFADSELTHDATGIVSLSMTEGPRYMNRMEFYGDRGTMRVDHLGELFIAKPGEDDWASVVVDLGTGVEGVPDSGFSRAFKTFAPILVEALRRGSTSIENAATFADGVSVQRVLDAARESDASGCAIEVQTPTPSV